MLDIFDIWGFPKNRGWVSPKNPFIDGFSLINHPAEIGVAPFMETESMGFNHHN